MKNLLLNFRQFKALALVLSFIFGNAVVAMAQAPTISSFSPNSGPVGMKVTITGTNFRDSSGDPTVTGVSFNGTASTFTVLSPTQVEATVAPGTLSGKISVTTYTGTASSVSDFTVYVKWVGGSNGNDWDFAANWSNGLVPTSATNVMIEPGGSPVITNAAECKDLTLLGASLTLNDAASNLNIYGDFSTSSSSFYHSAGNITFAGGLQKVPALTYHNVTISGNGTKELQGNAAFNNLTFLSSNLTTKDLNNITLTLNGSIAGEAVNRSFIGKMVKTRTVNGLGADNFGNIGISFDNNGGGNWGSVVATRITGQAVVNPTNASRKSINRYWIITPADENVGTNVTLTLTWFDSENNGLTFAGNQAQAWRKATGSAEWLPVDDMQTIAANGNERSITVNTTSFSSWAISDQMNPLPVSMTFFKGKATDAGSLLTWATASEKNSAAYEVERSLNGKDFEKVGTVRAAGNSNATLQYAFTDRNAAKNATNYYRLKMVDLDDTFEYSAIVMVNSSAKTTDLAVVAYPNPFNESLNLKLNNTVTNAEVTLTTIDGKQIYRQVIKEASPASDLKLNMPKLKPGFYLLNVMVDNKVTVLRVAQQ